MFSQEFIDDIALAFKRCNEFQVANEQQAKRITELEADSALKHVIKLREEIKEFKAKNKQLEQYRDYIMAIITRGLMPMEFQEWNETVDE